MPRLELSPEPEMAGGGIPSEAVDRILDRMDDLAVKRAALESDRQDLRARGADTTSVDARLTEIGIRRSAAHGAYRTRDPKKFVDEIEVLIRDFKVDFLMLADEEPKIQLRRALQTAFQDTRCQRCDGR